MKKLLLKTILFVGFVIIALMIKHFHAATRFLQIDKLDRALENQTEVILFGSSVNDYFAPNDSDKSSITDMLDSLTQTFDIVGIRRSAYNLDLYHDFCKYIVRQEYYPKLIIIPINMGTFGPAWDLRPDYQFERERLILNGRFRVHHLFMYVLQQHIPWCRNIFHEISDKEFRAFPVFHGSEKIGKVSEFEMNVDDIQDQDRYIREGLILYYLYLLKPDHRKLKSMVQIQRVLSDAGIDHLFYLTPIDYQTGERYFPNHFYHSLKENTQVVRRLLTEGGSVFLDMSTALDSSYFSYSLRPDEHLKDKGRLFVATKLDSAIRSLSLENEGGNE